MPRTKENPMREWFVILAGCIVLVGAMGFIPLFHLLISYIMGAFAFFAVVFGIAIIPFPKREVAQGLVACIFIVLLLTAGQLYGLL